MNLKDIPIAARDIHPVETDCKLYATAGAGKTTQELLRLIELIHKYNLDKDQFTCCTYRTELADELYQELQNEGHIDENANRSDTYIGTIHGICKRLLEQEGHLSRDVEFVTDEHKQEFCETYNITYSESKYEKGEGEKLFERLTYLNNTLVSPHSVEETVTLNNGDEKPIGDVYEMWVSYKDRNGLMEFDELVMMVEDFELTPPNRCLVIDEMHDVYPLLHETIDRWIQETKKDDNKTVIVAGDPRQVINSHQGTKPEFFIETDLPEIEIPKTYRCPEEVWDYAQSILDTEFDYNRIEANKDGGNLEIINRLKFTQKQGYWEVTGDNYDKYPTKIVEEHNDYGKDHRVMFLVRARHQIPAITTQLDKSGIIYDGQHPNSWTQKDDLLDLFNGLFKILSDEHKYASKDEVYAVYDALDEEYAETHVSIDNLDSKVDLEDICSNKILNTPRYKLISKIMIDEYDKSRLNEALVNYNEPIHKSEISVDVRTIHESKGMQAETVVLFDSITNRIADNIEKSETSRENECKTWFVGASRSSQNLFVVKNSFPSIQSSPFLPDE